MALRPKVAANHRNGAVKAPTKIVVNSSTSSTLEQLKKDASRAPSRVIRLRDKESVTVRFLQEPNGEEGWVRFPEHGYKRGDFWSRVPCHKGCPLDGKPENRPVTRWLANVVDVGTGEVRLLYLTKSMVDSFIIKYERSAGRNNDRQPTLLNRNWTIVRIGGDQDTKYEIDAEDIGPLEIDGKRVKISSFEKMDIVEELTQEIEAFYGTFTATPRSGRLSDDEEEEEVEDDEVEAEDEAEDVEEEEAEEEEEEAEDEEEDDAEEEEEEEEAPRPAKRPVARKPLPSAGKAVVKKPVRR